MAPPVTFATGAKLQLPALVNRAVEAKWQTRLI
jgi:hypothetical protein